MKNARRRSREAALQALYAWQLGGGDAAQAFEHAQAMQAEVPEADAFALGLVRGVATHALELRALIEPCLTGRGFDALSPVERAVLYIGSLELREYPGTPVKVVLNEAIDLGKSFGGAAGHRFVNGVLERVAERVRPDEVARLRAPA